MRSSVVETARSGPGRAVLLTLALVLTAIAVRSMSASGGQTTIRDGVYTKAQAERGKTAFDATCAKCHSLVEGVKTGHKDEGPALAGDKFLTKWDGRTVFDLVSNIRLNMPPDGSVFLEANETADLIAYLLQVNKFPEGEHELPGDTSARGIAITKSGR